MGKSLKEFEEEFWTKYKDKIRAYYDKLDAKSLEIKKELEDMGLNIRDINYNSEGDKVTFSPVIEFKSEEFGSII